MLTDLSRCWAVTSLLPNNHRELHPPVYGEEQFREDKEIFLHKVTELESSKAGFESCLFANSFFYQATQP